MARPVLWLPLGALIASSAAAQVPAEPVLGDVQVHGQAERAEGPVTGYRPTRSGTFAKTDTPLADTPASVSVVPGEVIRDTSARSLGDLFRYVPGAVTHQGEGNRDQVVLRGNSSTADFFIDGVRDDAQVFRDLYNLERVEVLKGPAGMAFGRGGAGGLVNRVAKRPVFGRVGEASFTLGSWNQRRAAADLGDKAGDAAAWRLNLMVENADSFRDGVDLSRHAINPTATLLLGDATSLTLGYEHLSDDRTADRGLPSQNGQPFGADPARFFGNAAQSRARSTVDGAWAVLEHGFAGGWQLKNTLRATHYDKFYQNVYAGSAVNGAGTLTLSAYNNANQRTNVFNQTDLTKSFRAGGKEHTLLLGAEVGRQDSSSLRNTGFFGAATALAVSAANPVGTATSFRQNGTDANNNVKADVFAVYAQDQVSLTRQWKAIAGLRLDRFRASFDDRRTQVAATDLARTDTAFSPRAGLVWHPTPSQSYYAGASYAFLPSAEQLSLATATASLAPETAKNLEAGARWDLRPGLTLSAARFRTDRNNVRVTDPANPGQFIKSGQLRSDGVEFGLQGDVTRDWQVYGGAAVTDARVRKAFTSGTAPGATINAGNRLALTPAQTFALWNRVRLNAGWSAGLGVIRQSASFAAVDNAVQLPAWTRLDGALYYAFRDGKSRLALNVENLLDRRYAATADGNNNLSPGAPRSLRMALSTAY